MKPISVSVASDSVAATYGVLSKYIGMTCRPCVISMLEVSRVWMAEVTFPRSITGLAKVSGSGPGRSRFCLEQGCFVPVERRYLMQFKIRYRMVIDLFISLLTNGKKDKDKV